MRLLSLLLPVAAASTCAITWQVETVDSEGDVGNGCRIAVDSGNTVHIVYEDDTNDALKHAWRDGGAWATEIVPTLGTIWSPRLALDAGGNPGISYFEPEEDVLYYLQRAGGGWSISAVDTVNNEFGVRHSLAMDSEGRPCILYENDHDLWYATLEGEDWEKETVFESTYPWWLDQGVALVLDPEDGPRILYEVSNNEYETIKYLRYGYRPGSSWQHRSIFSCDDGYYYQSLALDGSNGLHAAFSAEEQTDNRLYYGYSSNGLDWDVAELADEAPASISVDADPSGDPRVSYSVDGLVFAYQREGEWLFETVDASHYYGSQDMALDSYGNPYIAFSSGHYSDEDLMIAYSDSLSAESGGDAPGIGLSLPVNPAGGFLPASLSLPEPMDVRLDLYDLSGRRVRVLSRGAMGEGEHHLRWDVGDCPQGLYVVRLTTPLGTIARSCVIL